jgi:D-alanyl-lipoteichoic acid acyltransferase DltB (MBOAT superfamily)
MQFVTLQFAAFFLGVFVLAIPMKRMKKLYPWFILAVSLIFYGTWSIKLLLILVAEILLIYLLLYLASKHRDSLKRSKIILASVVVIVAAIWIFFKYLGFLEEPLSELIRNIGFVDDQFMIKIIAPIGISFFSFRLISAAKLITLKKYELPSIAEFAGYVSFFPQIISGPIMTLDEYVEDIRAPIRDYSIASIGISLTLGLFKKYIISSYLFDFIFDPFKTPWNYGSVDLLIAAAAYSAYIYVDFSGYTDLSNGISRLLGFREVKNFNMPYISKSVAEFWRRWHMTLGRWLKYHIYIPLGGSWKGLPRKYINLMIVMLFSGAWHGTGLNYVLWGGLHGIGIVVGDAATRIANKVAKKISPRLLLILKPFTSFTAWVLTLSFIILARIIFRAGSIEMAQEYFNAMLDPTTTESILPDQWRAMTYMFMAYLLSMTEVPIRKYLATVLNKTIFLLVIYLVIMIAIIELLKPSTVPPFLYFQF